MIVIYYERRARVKANVIFDVPSSEALFVAFGHAVVVGVRVDEIILKADL